MRDLLYLIAAILFAIFIIYTRPANSAETSDRVRDAIMYIGLGFTILNLVNPSNQSKEPTQIEPEWKPESKPPVDEPQQKEEKKVAKPKPKVIRPPESNPGIPTKYFVPKYAR